ncbi:MAG: 3-oxoacyl-ACP synthase III [Planctomycetia bacterium]|nr:3-oxoacyl-ACP synthase III [Planctomycetia bacterium]
MNTFTCRRVVLEAIAYTLPDEIVRTTELEERLRPVYERLKLPEGRLELMTGIRERRFFPETERIGEISARTARRLLDESGVDPANVGMLVHGSVCRDFLEPATACGVHHALNLPDDCAVYDLSNACLGQLTGLTQIADKIELGQIRAGIVVGTENARELVESTIRYLNTEPSLTRRNIKDAIASLTIGSASTAMLLVDESISRTPHARRLRGGVVRTNTRGCSLCQGDHLRDSSDHGSIAGTLMWTDSTGLLEAGVATAARAFEPFLKTVGWQRDQIDRTVCHQVGRAHTRRLFESLRLDPAIDCPTFGFLGNTGSAALPVTLAMAIEGTAEVENAVRDDERIAMLGIGSGINTMMLGLEPSRRCS